jgi:3-phenylpropionate/trans-cinnamate dioxygenase ferredoxin subunit
MSFIPMITEKDLILNKISLFNQKGLNLGIVKTTQGVFAFEDVCTHDGEAISEGILEDCKLTCPRHSAEFDLKTGEALCMPATEPLPVFPIRIIDGMVEVDLPEDF